MKEKTKERIKNVGLVGGAIGGGFVANYATCCLTAICPPVGIGAKIAQVLISSVIAEKSAKFVYDTADAVIDVANASEEIKGKILSKKEELSETTTTEEEATA